MRSERHIPVFGIKQNRRAVTVTVAMALFLAILILRLVDLAIIKHSHYSSLAFDQITTTSELKADRGNIYDSSMRLLATTKTGWRIFIFPKELKKRSKSEDKDYSAIIADGLSAILSTNRDYLYNKINKASSMDCTLKRLADEEEYEKILAFIEEKELGGILNVEAQSVRYYPSGVLAAHVLGFTGSDGQGLYGLEYQYNSLLSGTDGYYLYAKDAGGIALPGDFKDTVAPVDGADLITTIDTYLQEELESIIEKIRINHGVENRVTGVIMNNETGAILAMATTSPFDPNDPFILDDQSQKVLDSSGYAEGSDEYKKLKTELMSEMWSNKAVSEIYEPGSTFKIVTVAAALDSGSSRVSDTFSCHGFHSVGGWRIKCHKVTGHGSGFDLAYGLQMSCNPTMMTVAERMGSEVFYDYVERFGYLGKSGIDLPGEGSTVFHKENAIGATELATASFGQRFKISIINHLRAVSAVANGGYLVEPYVVEKAIDKNGNVVYSHDVKRTQIISKETANTVADILEKGVSGEGGAKNAYVEGYKIAAKTGTSQKFDILDENGNSYLRIGSTVAFSPSDSCGISAIIVVDEPTSQVKYGSVVAAPYIGELMSKALPYLEYRSSVEVPVTELPNTVGMNINSAKSLLNEKNIPFKAVGNGNVVLKQSPCGGMGITSSNTVVILYTEIPAEYILPDMRGMTAKEANLTASALGLNLRILGFNGEGDLYKVTNQDIPPGSKVINGDTVTLTVVAYDFED